ncbi:alkaline phosphatase D family protein [Planotetraspora phitsanulokensis]|uniref:alkaline phosphatase D family protein n=1 Tax=Planotetraspora phitsanulokensis TaxID=575192 RepID=UPI00194DF1E1|nr:alkaline phosphatase D family protein [Planotetraspora phitsanulokensis]
MQTNASRRVFLSAAVAGAGGLLLSGSALPSRLPYGGALKRDPFTLGVASGDPTPDGIVLWTRLALEPTAPDGLGGMPSGSFDVEWQLASDERFSKIVKSGTATTGAGQGHSVHVEVNGLEPGREYFYRFRADGHVSPVGRTRTAPTGLTPLKFVMAACAHWEHGYYTAYRRISEQDPDLVVHLGDYIYEYAPSGYTAVSGVVRRHAGRKCQSLGDYRLRLAQYKSDPDLQAAHQVAPWLVVFDDHEVENNWAGPVSSTGAAAFAQRKAAAFRAYYENMPLRRGSLQKGGSIRINRRIDWGTMATFHLLDTRQFRDDQACDDGERSGCDDRLDTGRSILGADQRGWLLDGLGRSESRWNLIGQQVIMAQRDGRTGPGVDVNMDSWDGYAADRTRLLQGIERSGAANPVVLTGDAHTHYAATLKPDFADPDSPQVAVELVTSSISSDGDGYRDTAGIAETMRENPHFSYIDQRRGYIVCSVSQDEMRAEFRTLDYITRRGAPAKTSARFTIPSGHAQLSA